MRRMWHLAFVALLFSVQAAQAHSGFVIAQEQEVKFRVEKLSDRAYALYGRGGTVGFVVTDEGILVIDDQYENVAPGIVEEIRKVSDKPIRFLINTHYHGDHVGGNTVFGDFALIIAHENVRKRMLGQAGIFQRELPSRIQALERNLQQAKDGPAPFLEFLQAEKRFLESRLEGARKFDPDKIAPPVVTYNNRLTVHLGNEEVRVFHIRAGHTDGDSIVYLPGQNVVHMGDLFVGPRYPFIDRVGGGHSGEWIATLEAVLRMMPPDVKVIAGHGEVGTRKDLMDVRDYLIEIRRQVGKAVGEGKSLRETMEAIDRTKFEGMQDWFMKLENNIDVIYQEMQGGN